MGRITTNIGLISGIPIKDTVDQLVAVQARPRDLLVQRTKLIQQEQVAVSDLSARLLGVQVAAKALGDAKLFESRAAASSDAGLLAVSVTGTPALGTSQFTPLRVATLQQQISGGFASDSTALGAGTLSFRFGGAINADLPLDQLNAGAGFARGKLRITDRSGASAEVDLRFAQTLDDVLRAINSNGTVQVRAEAVGDRLRLTDETGQAAANLRVQEVNLGTTATSLGLAGINVAASQADGTDIVSLYGSLALDRLNDGNGVDFHASAADLQITLRDNAAPLTINFQNERTLADVLATLNAAAPARLKAELAPDGDRILLTDLSTDNGGTLAVAALNGSQALADLGLDKAASGATLSGRRLVGGLQTSLLRTLGGGAGLGTLGLLDLTDRGGATAQVNLGAAETVDDVLAAINAAPVGIEATINAARNGILLSDTTGLTASNLIVANGDGTNTATKLKLAVSAAQASKSSGSLDRQFVGRGTTLASLGGGRGVAAGSFTVFDVDGDGETVTLTAADTTVGHVLDKLNALDLDVEARINDTGDGILLVSTKAGTSPIQVFEGSTTTAADLGLKRSAETIDVGGSARYAINGKSTVTVTLDADDTLRDLVTKINAAGGGVTASTFRDGSGPTPFRLLLQGTRTGRQAEVLFDTSGVGFSLAETSRAEDAVLALGSVSGFAAPAVVTSASNTFADVAPGLSLTVGGASTNPVTITVTPSNARATQAVQAFVDAYNQYRSKLAEYTKFDAEANKVGILQGDASVQRIESTLSQTLSGRFVTGASLQSLGGLGIEFRDDGTLSFNSLEFQLKLAQDGAGIKQLFTTATTGVAAKLESTVKRLAGDTTSLLGARSTALQRKVTTNNDRVTQLNARLERVRTRLLNQFAQLELAIGKLQNSQSALTSLANLASSQRSTS